MPDCCPYAGRAHPPGCDCTNRDVLSDRSACALCEGEGNVVQGLSIYASDHAYPEIVQCPDCGGTGLASDEEEARRG